MSSVTLPRLRVAVDRDAVQPLLNYSDRLDDDAGRLLNESRLASRLDEFLRLPVVDRKIHALCCARLTELTLLTAGRYADAAEFRAAGDLLVNPRHIDVHVRGMDSPVRKARHQPLSEQFASLIGNADPLDWLTRHTIACVQKQALLPRLRELLERSGALDPQYLESIERRMCRVADTLALLAAWRVTDGADLELRLRRAGERERIFLEANLCRFDPGGFDMLGEEIRCLAGGRKPMGDFPGGGSFRKTIDEPSIAVV